MNLLSFYLSLFPLGIGHCRKLKNVPPDFTTKKSGTLLLTGRFSLTADGTLRCIRTVTKQKYID
jgi:hypothetical protein